MFILAEKHKSYSVEFKEYIAKMVVLDGHKVTDVCKKLEIPYGTLKRWVQNHCKKQREAEEES